MKWMYQGYMSKYLFMLSICFCPSLCLHSYTEIHYFLTFKRQILKVAVGYASVIKILVATFRMNLNSSRLDKTGDSIWVVMSGENSAQEEGMDVQMPSV